MITDPLPISRIAAVSQLPIGKKRFDKYRTFDAQRHSTPDENPMLRDRLLQVLTNRELTVLFQPIADMQTGGITGYEGLIRGPSDSPLHSPINLFKVARAHNLCAELETLCCTVVAARFAELKLPGKLFLNVSPESLLQFGRRQREVALYLNQIGIRPERVIIELTENQPAYDYNLLRDAVVLYRSMGFQVAIDDLGEGFSSLRLWSELRPEYVKIDMHFIHDIHQDSVKRQFVRSIQEIAVESGTRIIAEGIESHAELTTVRDLGIAHAQGYHISRPKTLPPTLLGADIAGTINPGDETVTLGKSVLGYKSVTASKLAAKVKSVSPEVSNQEVYAIFNSDPGLQLIPIIDGDVPVGLITRADLISQFAKPYLRELFGKKPCSVLMDDKPLLVDKDLSLQKLSQTIADAEKNYLSSGFIITDRGRYLGVATGQTLMRELNQMQITAARYANPLTLLPGNVPIQDHINRLLKSRADFTACYVDLDHFKAFNDMYGYQKGDDVITLVGRLLTAHCDPALDFVGHIGGDDFIMLFQSSEWEQRCLALLDDFASSILCHFTEEDRQRGGYASEDRLGHVIFHPLITMSIGAVQIDPASFSTHYQIAAVAADAKKEAKKLVGNKLFIERRHVSDRSENYLSVPA